MSGWIAGSDRKRLRAPSTAGRYERMVVVKFLSEPWLASQ
jgi:hypothetical protein